MVGIACLNTAMKNAPLRNSSVPSLCITSSPFHFLFTLRFDKLSDPGGQCLMKCTRRTLTRFDRLFDRFMCISSSTIYAFHMKFIQSMEHVARAGLHPKHPPESS